MTVGTNALLEGHLARTALVTTDGFGDVLELRRQNRADLYRLDGRPSSPGGSARARGRGRASAADPMAADSRWTRRGPRAAHAVQELEVEAVAVACCSRFAIPNTSARVATAVRTRCRTSTSSISSEVLAEIREYERAATTAVDAALTPLLQHVPDPAHERTGAAGLPSPEVMQSNGGLID